MPGIDIYASEGAEKQTIEKYNHPGFTPGAGNRNSSFSISLEVAYAGLGAPFVRSESGALRRFAYVATAESRRSIAVDKLTAQFTAQIGYLKH